MNPLEMHGPEFLRFFGIAIAVASVLAVVYRITFSYAKSMGNEESLPELNPWQLAYLRNGDQAVAQTALIDLAAKKLITGDPVTGRFVANSDVDPVPLEAIPNALFRASQMGYGVRADRAADVIRYECEKIKQSLLDQGVLQTFEQRVGLTWPGLLAFAAVLLLGSAKLVVGLSRGKPVEYLLLLLFLATALAMILNYTTQLTRVGRLAMEKEISKIRDARTNLQTQPDKSSPQSLMDDLLLYGMHPLAIGIAAEGFSQAYSDDVMDVNTRKLAERMHPQQPPLGGDPVSSGCGGGDGGTSGAGAADGGSGDGASGCGGGGCGGGGCGGCGG
ncbi:MAG: TIGR04222 domain-containing membrane protein [Pirellula sp.]|jgi:uncharacterized protein (TIGR04222 family)|nr:TIGR04222 domain-containing membrane protein [Pirellula sp.]